MYIAAQLYFPFLIHITFNSPSPTLLHFNNMLEITFNFFHHLIPLSLHKINKFKIIFSFIVYSKFSLCSENFKDRYIFMLNDIKYCLHSTFKIYLIPCLFLFLFMYITFSRHRSNQTHQQRKTR